MKKLLNYLAILFVGLILSLFVWVIWINQFPNLGNLIPIEDVGEGGMCKSDILVKNLGTEDQVIIKDVIFEREKYLGTHVSKNTKCSRIFYSSILGGYGPPTSVPTTEPEIEEN